jgi:restriction endonuclease
VKLHFESDLDYQWTAVESVCDLFRGQETCRTEFTVTMKAPAASMGDELFPETVLRECLHVQLIRKGDRVEVTRSCQ